MDCSILVVDHTPQLMIALSEALEGNRYSVTWVVDGVSALHALREKSYRLIVADLTLYQVNGCNILQKVLLQKPDTMVVLAFDSYDISLSKSSYLLAADDYLVKTSDKAELAHRVTKILQRCAHFLKIGLVDKQVCVRNDQIPHSIFDSSVEAYSEVEEPGSPFAFI